MPPHARQRAWPAARPQFIASTSLRQVRTPPCHSPVTTPFSSCLARHAAPEHR